MNENTDTVAVQEVIEDNTPSMAIDSEPVTEENVATTEVVEEQEEKTVPLSAHIKERKKRQEAEQRNKFLEEFHLKQMQATQQVDQEPDDSQYEPITKAELLQREKIARAETVRDVEERIWIKQNPEKLEAVLERLPDFLKQRPNLTSAINEATNRYEEAWELMDKLTPRQKAALMAQPNKVNRQAPNSPSSMPKSAAMGQSVNVMNMSDSEFAAWRQSKRTRR